MEPEYFVLEGLMKLVDSHIHLDFTAFDADRAILMEKAKFAGIIRFVVPATTRKSWPRINKLSQQNAALSVAYGIHPYFVQSHSADDFDALDAWIETHPCVAVGEIGLDFFLKEIDPVQQMEFFEAQLRVANNHRLPVILHARKAVDAVTQQLKMAGIRRGIVHSFNGSYEQAQRLIEMGFMLGFGGALTYPRATRLQALVKRLPLESICLETDAPDQPACRFAGRRNEPLALIEVLETVARLHHTTPEIIAQYTTDNTYAALNI